MNDLKPFKHGEEGTHYVCQEVLELKGGKATCCGCSGHKCKKPKPMKRIKKECKHDEHHATTKDGEHWCPVCREVLFSSPKPTKIKCGLKHKHGYWNCCACCIQGEVKGEGAWGHVKECEFYPKIKKKLVIKEEWCETTFEQQKDRLYVHMRYFEDDDSGGKWEGGSSSFSVPLKKLKDYLLSH
jgi:hypothetical protein